MANSPDPTSIKYRTAAISTISATFKGVLDEGPQVISQTFQTVAEVAEIAAVLHLDNIYIKEVEDIAAVICFSIIPTTGCRAPACYDSLQTDTARLYAEMCPNNHSSCVYTA